MPHKKSTPDPIVKVLALLDGADLFVDQLRRPCGTFRDARRTWTYCLGDTAAVTSFLRRLALERWGQNVHTSVIEEVLSVLVAKAQSGPMREVFVRVGSAGDTIFLDLARNDGAVVKIAPGWWEVVTDPEVKFKRPTGMMPLPLPSTERTDLRTELSPVLGLADETAKILLAAYLLGCLSPDIPQPVLEIIGHQGAGKSTLTRALRTLIDPNLAPVRRIPSNERDLFITAHNSWLLCLDNISSLPTWFSDAACSIASGGGFATRRLYKDEDESIFYVRRPVVVNSIHEVVTRPDLRDRAITVTLPRISPMERLTEQEYWEEFRHAHPRILAALLDCAVAALVYRFEIRPASLPRMADWFRWISAAAEDPGFGHSRAAFEMAYTANRQTSRELAIDASPVGRALLALVVERSGRWRGTLTNLLAELNGRVGPNEQFGREWPKSPEALRHLIDRVAPDLLASGLSITFSRSMTKTRERLVELVLQGEAQ